MAIATSYKTSAKEALLAKINALVWTLQYLSAAGALPSKEHLALKYPALSREKLLWYLGCKTEDEVKEKLGQLILKFEGLQQTLVQEANTPEEIKKVPPEVLQSEVFAGKSEGEVGKSILSSLSDLQKEPTEEELRLIEPPERRTIPATLVDPHASFSPTYNEAAEIMAQAGLIDENGEPNPGYKNLLTNSEFKKEVEQKLRSAILAQDLESQIIDLLDERFASAQVPHELIQKEFNFAKKQIAEQYAQTALEQLSAVGIEAVSLSQASQAARRVIEAKIEKDKPALPHFFDSILAANPNLEKDGALRKEIVDKLTNAAFEALGAFSGGQNVWVSLGDDLPRVAAAHYFLDEKGKLKRSLHQYWILPQTPEVQEKEVEEERNDQEVMLAALYKETNTIPNPNVAKYLGQERPKPRTVWPYYVGAPLFAGWFITDPAGAITLLPYGATAIAGYIGAEKVKEKVKAFKLKLQPFLNPAEYLHQKYSQAVQRLIFQQIPAKMLRMTPLYKNYEIKGLDGRIYQYAEFRPARFLRSQTGRILEKFAGEKTGSIRHRVFSRAKENITPRVNPRTKKVEKKHHGLLGVIIGVLMIDVLAGALWEFAKDRVVMLAKIERALGPAGRIGKSAFSLNTAAGAYTGFMIGAPLGLSMPLALLGGLGGWGFQAAKDWAKDQSFLLRQAQREQLLAEGKLVSRGEIFATRVGRIPRFLARYPLVENLPLKGATFGYLISGGNPLGALAGALTQGLWSNRAVIGGFAKGTIDDLVWKSSGAKYTDLSHFVETGINKWPLWQRAPIKMLAEFRYLGRWVPGAGVGGAVGLLASGGNPLGALVGAAMGGTTQLAVAYVTRTTIYLTRAAFSALGFALEKYVLHNFRMLYLKNPWMRFVKGGTAGVGIGLLLAYLGIPIWLAIPAGILIGTGAQWAIEKLLSRFFGRAGVEAGAEVAGVVGARTLAGGLRLFVGKLIGAFTGVGTAFAAFDIARGLCRYMLEHGFKDYETWKKTAWFGKPSYLQYRIEKWFVQNLEKVLNVVLWPWDRFWDWFFGPLWSSFLGPFLTKAYLVAYNIGKFLFGWTTKLPGFLGDLAGKAGDFFGGIKNAITGGIQAFLGIVMGLLGGLLQLLLGGDVAEAALAAAIGLALAGSIINAATISGAFSQNPEEILAGIPIENPYILVAKTANPPHLENNQLEPSAEITFTISLVAKNHSLTNVKLTESINVRTKSGLFSVTKDKNNQSITNPKCDGPSGSGVLNPGESCTVEITILATKPPPDEERDFSDSLITNTVTIDFKVTNPEPGDQENQKVQKTALVTIGTPPTSPPCGWPCSGYLATLYGEPTTYEAAHSGIDIAASGDEVSQGQSVYATTAGTITDSFWTTECGGVINITTVTPTATYWIHYVHMSNDAVNKWSAGDSVEAGKFLGKTHAGALGDCSNGTHLHYAIKVDGNFVDPLGYTPGAAQGGGVSAGGCWWTPHN